MIGTVHRKPARAGMSLLEVLLAIAVLGVSIATVGELVRVGALAAANARDMTAAQLLAETKMSELTSGLYPLSSVTEAPDEMDPQWLYSINTQPIDQNGLVAVQVLIRQNLPESQRPVQYELIRWMREDDLIIEEEETSEEESSASSGGASSGASSSGASSGASSAGGGTNGR